MSISIRTLETLVDLVEIKLSCMEIYDRDDARELANLERCIGELRALMGNAAQSVSVVAFPQAARKRTSAAV